jgi:predicted RNA polymerase sigma factor
VCIPAGRRTPAAATSGPRSQLSRMVKQTKGRGWSATLAPPIVLRDGTKLDTLADVRAFILEELSQADQARNAWQKAAELLLSTAEEKGDIAVVTKQIELALFMQGKWLLK